jgi:hypothetical protein
MQARVLERAEAALLVPDHEDRGVELLEAEEVARVRDPPRRARDHPGLPEHPLLLQRQERGIGVPGARHRSHQARRAQAGDLRVLGSFGTRHGVRITGAGVRALQLVRHRWGATDGVRVSARPLRKKV